MCNTEKKRVIKKMAQKNLEEFGNSSRNVSLNFVLFQIKLPIKL